MTRHRQLRSRAHRRSMRTRGRALSTQVEKTRNAQRDHAALPRCVDGGKIRYATQREADHTLNTLDRANPARREKNSYRCAACDGWHLTSWTLAEHENYLAVTSGATAHRHRAYPLTDYVPAVEFMRAPRDLSSIAAAPAAIPTPGEVAARTTLASLEIAAAEPLQHAERPSRRTASPALAVPHPNTVASPADGRSNACPAVPARPSTNPAAAKPISHVMPSPAEVAARTVPIKRAEAARRQAELTASMTATQRKPTSAPARPRNLLRAMLQRLMRRLRRS
ncbi:hypothetical protein [Nocardia tengchongensis]|uniref:hypothetical protein n=1 Tax=Nocardia tengchongensis TaxID=2055889 RepID=UPI003611025C